MKNCIKKYLVIVQKKIECFSTPAHPTDVDMLEKFNVKYHKIGSDDAVNIPLLKYVAKTKKYYFINWHV